MERKIKKLIKTIVKFCSDSPFEYESNDIKDRKVARIFEHAQDYYYTMAIAEPQKLAMQLAKRDMQVFLNDMEKINLLYDGIRKQKKAIV
jgi:hypothetical protein